MNRVFITYNPKSDQEQTLAVRLHTLGAVHGFRMYLPDRTYNEVISEETQAKIQKSDWIIYFSLGTLSPQVKAEIEYAYQYFQDKRKIIVIYDSTRGKNLKGGITEHCSSFYFNSLNANSDEVIANILTQLRQTILVEENTKRIQQQKIESNKTKDKNSLLTFIGIGVGLLLLSSLISNDSKPEKTNRKKRP